MSTTRDDLPQMAHSGDNKARRPLPPLPHQGVITGADFTLQDSNGDTDDPGTHITKRVGLRTKRMDMKTKRMVLTTKRMDLTTKRIGLTTKRMALTTKRMGLTTKRMDLTTKRIGLKTKRMDLTAKRMDLTAKRMALRTKRMDMKTKRMDLTTKRIGLKTKRMDLTTKHIGLKTKRMDLIAKRMDLAAKRMGLRTKRMDLTAKLIGLTTKRLDLTTKRMALRTKRMDMKTKRMGLTTKRMDLAAQRMGLTTKWMGLTTKRMGLTTKRIGLTTKRMDLTTKRTDLETKRMGLTTKRMGLRIKRMDMKTKRMDLTTKRIGLTTKRMGLTMLYNRKAVEGGGPTKGDENDRSKALGNIYFNRDGINNLQQQSADSATRTTDNIPGLIDNVTYVPGALRQVFALTGIGAKVTVHLTTTLGKSAGINMPFGMAAEGNWTTAKPVQSSVTGTYLPVNVTAPAFVSEAKLYEETGMLSPSNGTMTTPNSMPDITAQCPNLTPPAKGSMTGSNTNRDVVHFTCNKGYRLVGSSSLTCQSDGTWSGSSPTCRAGQCPYGWYIYGNHCYKLFGRKVDWYTAKSRCEQFGAHLLSITNAKENNFINGLISKVGERTVWMGLREKYRRWCWLDGSGLIYQNWYPGEPDNDSFMMIFDQDVNCAGLYTQPGQQVRVEVAPNRKAAEWRCGTLLQRMAPRSYEVEVDGAKYRRNRKHIRDTTGEQKPSTDVDETTTAPATPESTAVKECEEAVSQDMKRVSEWLTDNRLSLHPDKAKSMLFGVPQKLRHVGRTVQTTVVQRGCQALYRVKVSTDHKSSNSHGCQAVCGLGPLSVELPCNKFERLQGELKILRPPTVE
ncbi:carbohydrate binding [Branchiostoma belcheri]|nr:carbohydrate binding [Branchiostoma belcheri]